MDHYAAVLDAESVGLGLTVFVAIRVKQRSRATAHKIEEGLLSSPHVVACHMVTGDADFLVEIVVEDLKDHEKVLLDGLLAIDEVTGTRSWFAFRTARSRGALPVA